MTIKLDAFVTSESTHSELCKALKVSSFHNRKLSIVIGRLAMTCLGQARISLLLKQLHPQVGDAGVAAKVKTNHDSDDDDDNYLNMFEVRQVSALWNPILTGKNLCWWVF